MKEAPIEQATSKERTAKADRKERDKEKRAEKEKIRSRNGSRSRSSSREGKLSSSSPPAVKTLTAVDDSEIFRVPRRVGERGKSKDGVRSRDSFREQSRTRADSISETRSEDEESVASITSRGKKQKIIGPEVSDRLKASPRDVGAEVLRHQAEVLRVAVRSSNLKGTYIRTHRDATEYTVAAWSHQTSAFPMPDFLDERTREACKAKLESMERRIEDMVRKMNEFQKGTTGAAVPTESDRQSSPIKDRGRDDVRPEMEALKKKSSKHYRHRASPDCNTVASFGSSSSESRGGLNRYYRQAWENLHETAGHKTNHPPLRRKETLDEPGYRENYRGNNTKRDGSELVVSDVATYPSNKHASISDKKRHHHHHHHHHGNSTPEWRQSQSHHRY
ncbi:uncharacterized protein LOC132915827 [Bombus pascuorum]|uniref:uncharacterized protein LOC132915827 n=1 Tax=Bombus pascuorum TaxID=65598 RepID=UPI00298EBE51|nr:uncharacterized protein LOC132915827 [Bombus pascuorum]